MGKSPNTLIFLAACIILLLYAGCVRTEKREIDSVSAASGHVGGYIGDHVGGHAGGHAGARKGPPAQALLQNIMPGAMSDGMVKIAAVVHQRTGDQARQFLEGCVSEGRSLGFIVDTFVTDSDEEQCRKIAAGIAQADYDGLVFTNGDERYSYETLKPIADKGIQIVTFETRPYRDGKYIKNLFTTYQDDYSLARLSLETLLSCTVDGEPARVIRIACDPGITFLDRRAWVFNEFTHNGKIIEAALVNLGNMDNPQSEAWEGLAAILPLFPPGSVDALWVPWDEFAKGCAGSLAAAGRQDIALFSIGISNDTIRVMQRHCATWIANTALNPKLTGTVTMRILAAKLANENVPEPFLFSPELVKSADLHHAVNIANIAALVPGWGNGEGLFDHYQWMIDLKAAEGKYLRLPVVQTPEPKAQP